MNKYISRACTVLVAASSLTLTGCFNLEENVYSEITEDSFSPTEQDVTALVESAYTDLSYIYDWQGYFDVQEESGDVIITPTRPNGWDDGGTYRDMHKHQWSNMSWQPWNAYLTPFYGINNANRVKDQIEKGELPITGELKDETIAELRAVRALWYSMLLDTHGNVPLVTAYTDSIPKQATRTQVFDFVVSELKDVIPHLSKANDGTTYGRMNKWAAFACLMRVYLNAQVYTGVAHWADAEACADSIIESGIFDIADDYSDCFKENVNYSCPEAIFAVVYDQDHTGFAQHHKWYPSVARQVFGNSHDYFWGGSCANPQFIDSYMDGDLRKEKTWLMGPQYSASDPTKLVWTCKNRLPSLTCMQDGHDSTSIDWGYRVMKFEYNSDTKKGAWSNDFLFFRYSEVILTKAECRLRQDDAGSAVALVNQLRQKRFAPGDERAKITPADLLGDTRIKYGTLDWNGKNNGDDSGEVTYGGMYDEWGWEFACEAQRRTQMIRFGTYTTKNWFNKTVAGANEADGHTKLFPIPLEELQANENLKQNPGYSSTDDSSGDEE